jgi:two-component system phosphate regulon sensor histidine kinase PhoR
MSFWLPPLLRILLVAFAGIVVGLLSGAAAGFATASVGFLALVLVQLRYLYHLRRWLRSPALEEIPDGWGAWGDVFAEMYKAHRREQKSRAQLAQALDRFVQAAQSMPDAVILLDARDRIVWANSMAERQFGIELEKDRGQLITNLVRYPGFAGYLATDRPTEPFTLHATAPLALTLSVQVTRFSEEEKLVLSRDVTAIERSDTIRRDFIANVSHELRTPLTVINGYLEHMTEGTLADARLARPLKLMHDQSARMARLVEDLLTLSRLEAADNTPRDDDVDVPRLVAELVEEGRSLSHGRHSIEADIAPERLRGAADELRSAFSNLVTNAIRYTPEGGTIRLAWSVDERGGRFSVADTGIGVAPEHLPRLTERFYRIDRSRSRETGGTGLGLAIVKHVLLRHHGTLDVQSKPGTGSTFTCVFPQARIVPARAQEAA